MTQSIDGPENPFLSFPDFTSGGLLNAADFNLEMASQDALQRLYNQAGRQPGVVYGLDVSLGEDLRSLLVQPGLALDADGRAILLDQVTAVSTDQIYEMSGYVVIWLDQDYSDWRAYPNASGNTRILNTPTVSAYGDQQKATDDTAIVLASFTIGNDRLLEAVSYASASTPRTLSTLSFADVEMPRPDTPVTSFNPGIPLSIRPFLEEATQSSGLRLTAPRMDIFGSFDAVGTITIGERAAAQPGSSSPALWVSPPGAIAGSSRISNDGKNVYTAPGGTFGAVSAGDTLIFQPDPDDLSQGVASSVVAQVQTASTLTVENAPATSSENVHFAYKMSRLLRVVDGYGRTALSANVSGSVWLGGTADSTNAPTLDTHATLNVLGGDITLGAGHALSFDQTGFIQTPNSNVMVGAYPGATTPLALSAAGGVSFYVEASGVNAAASLVIAETERVGIGVDDPAFALSVNGPIKAQGLVFPDGSEQDESVIPIPIGTIVDWWRPSDGSNFSQEGFQACDGSTITDKDSPLYGQSTPDLSNLLVRGTTSYSDIGSTGGTPSHTHSYVENQHTHPIVHSHVASGETDATSDGAGDNIIGDSDLAPKGHTHSISQTSQYDGSLVSGQNSQSTTQTSEAGSNLPPHMFVLKVMRIK